MFVVRLGIAVFREDLREVVAIGVLNEDVLRLLRILLFAVELVDTFFIIVVVNFLMHKSFHGQFLRQGGLFHGIAHRDAGHRDNMVGQLQYFHEFVDIVGNGTEPAEAESEGFGRHASVLRRNERIGDGPLVSLQIAVSLRISVAEAAILVEAAEVCAEGEDHRRGSGHRLVEVQRREFGLHLGIARHDDAEQLHVAHRGTTAGCLEDQVQGLVIDRLVGVFAHTDVVEEGFQRGVIVWFYDTYALTVWAYDGGIVFTHDEWFFRLQRYQKLCTFALFF